MFAVEVRDRIMIGHSLPDPFFGPAQNMHGATFVVDVAFFRESMTKQNVVVDIGGLPPDHLLATTHLVYAPEGSKVEIIPEAVGGAEKPGLPVAEGAP